MTDRQPTYLTLDSSTLRALATQGRAHHLTNTIRDAQVSEAVAWRTQKSGNPNVTFGAMEDKPKDKASTVTAVVRLTDDIFVTLDVLPDVWELMRLVQGV